MATADGHGPLRAEFDAWNATQVPPLVVEIAIPTPPPTPFQDYARPFVANAPLWVRIDKTLDDARATLPVSPTAADITTCLKLQASNVTALIVNNAPPGIIAAFTAERQLRSLTTAINSMTNAQLVALIDLGRIAASQGLTLAIAATMPLD
jgi:hypothetical protein